MRRHKSMAGSVSMLGLMVLSGLAVTPVAAQAQEQVRSASLEEIVVTSRKRGAEVLQDIPATISAIAGDQLEKMGALNFDDFAYQVPGLTFTDEGSGQKRYVVRGIRSAGQEQVAVYYDEVPLPGVQGAGGDSGSQTTDLKLFDMERVEVLKGPQGTTFGANSQSGTVRFITRKPVMNEVQGQVKAGANKVSKGDLGANVYGMLNMPLVQDKLSLRTVAYYDREGGYIDNVRLGVDDINWYETTGIRAALRFEPTEKLSIDAMAWIQNRDSGGSSRYNPYPSFSDSPDNLDFLDGSGNPWDELREIAHFETGDLKVGDYTRTDMPDDQEIYSLTLNWDLDWASLVMAGSIYKREFHFKRDSTWVLMRLGVRPDFAPGGGVRPDYFPALTDQYQTMDQKSFEVRLNSNPGTAFQWMGGFFYRDRKSYFRSFVPAVDPVTGKPFDPGTPYTGYVSGAPGEGFEDCHPCVTARENDRKIEEIAFFGEVSYALNEQFEVMAGLRWFQADQSDFGVTNFPFALFDTAPIPEPDARQFKEDQLIKKFQVSYTPTDDMVFYALASEGYRLGGTNQQGIVAVPLGYESDSIWNYELGAKTTWFDRRLYLNLAAFVIKWDNLQVSGRDPTGAFAFIGNAGKAEVRGLEAELQARLTEGLEFNAGFAWLPKRELTQDQISDTIVAPGRKGDKLPNIPAFTANAAAQYNFATPVEGWEAFIRGEFNYVGKSNSELNPTSIFNRVQRSYELVNLRAGAINVNSDLDITFYVENVFDKRGDLRVRTEDSLLTFKWTTRPRTVGMDISKRF